MQYYAIVNEYERIPIFKWDAPSFNSSEELQLATDDLAYVKTVFKEINSISIVDNENNQYAEYTQYDSYQNISYNGRAYSSDINDFADFLVVKLQKTNLTEEVERINKKVNNVIDINSMTVEEYKEYLLQQFSDKGRQLIFEGTNVTLTDGTIKRFTYNLEDQSNLLNVLFTIQALGDLNITFPYHSHTEPCSLYRALDILLIYFTLQFFSVEVQTKVNMLCAWVRSTNTKEELEQIKFDSELPSEYMERVTEIMAPTYELAMTLMRKYFPESVVENTIPQEDESEGENEDEGLDENEDIQPFE